MNWHKIAYTIISGLAGFFFLLLARGIALSVALKSISIFAPASLSPQQAIMLFCIPPLIVVGAGIVAWSLGASRRRSLITGILAFTILFLIESGSGNYSPFNERESSAFIVAALTTILFATIGKLYPVWRWLVTLGSITVLLLLLIQFAPNTGFYVALVAWTLPPTIIILAQNKQFLELK